MYSVGILFDTFFHFLNNILKRKKKLPKMFNKWDKELVNIYVSINQKNSTILRTSHEEMYENTRTNF